MQKEREIPKDRPGWAGNDRPNLSSSLTRLLLNYSAGDSGAGVAGGVGLVVVGLGVNHQSRSALVKQRVRTVAEGDVFGHDRRVGVAHLVHIEVQQVAGMRPHGVVLPVHLALGTLGTQSIESA